MKSEINNNWQKMNTFFKKNLSNFVVAIICLVYIFFGLVQIGINKNDWWNIAAYFGVAFMVGFTIKAVWSESGIQDGLNSQPFIEKISFYGEKKASISKFSEELDPFCEYENKTRLKQAREDYLFKFNLKYDKYIKGAYNKQIDELYEKSQKRHDRNWQKAHNLEKILKNVEKINVYQYTFLLITNAYDSESAKGDNEKKTLSASLPKFRITSKTRGIFTHLLNAILFAAFTLTMGTLNWASLIWYCFQVAVFLINGQIAYSQGYNYVVQNMRAKVERVINIIDEFINIRDKNPGIFEEKIKINLREEEENKENEETASINLLDIKSIVNRDCHDNELNRCD